MKISSQQLNNVFFTFAVRSTTSFKIIGWEGVQLVKILGELAASRSRRAVLRWSAEPRARYLCQATQRQQFSSKREKASERKGEPVAAVTALVWAGCGAAPGNREIRPHPTQTARWLTTARHAYLCPLYLHWITDSAAAPAVGRRWLWLQEDAF